MWNALAVQVEAEQRLASRGEQEVVVARTQKN